MTVLRFPKLGTHHNTVHVHVGAVSAGRALVKQDIGMSAFDSRTKFEGGEAIAPVVAPTRPDDTWMRLSARRWNKICAVLLVGSVVLNVALLSCVIQHHSPMATRHRAY